MSKVFVLGLDGVSPELLFDEWIDKLPNLKKLMDNGTRGIIESTIPPSTTIAWNAFASGKDASGLGFFSYTFKENGKTRIYNSTHVKSKLLWDILSDAGKRVIVLNVPLTYPPKKVNGSMITGFLTPDATCEYSYPQSLKQEIESHLGRPYIFDVTESGLGGYKSLGKKDLLEKIYEMTDLHIKALKYLIKEKEWDFLMCVLLGTDRILHTFLSYHDKTHRKYKPSEFETALFDFFKHLDKEIGEILKLLDEDTTVIISSDHGIKKVDGKVNLNDWFIREGYLTLKEQVTEPARFDISMIDWSHTKAYSIGSYQGRVYFNLQGRDDNGVVSKDKYNVLQDELAKKLAAIPDEKGNPLSTKCYKPQEIYSGPYTHQSPDLIVYFDNLIWGVNGDVGNKGNHSWEDKIGATDGGHSPEGIIMVSGRGIKKDENMGKIKITEVASFILSRLSVPIPGDIEQSKERWNNALL